MFLLRAAISGNVGVAKLLRYHKHEGRRYEPGALAVRFEIASAINCAP